MADTEIAKTDVFKFMNLRAPQSVSKKSITLEYIHDDVLTLSGELRTPILTMLPPPNNFLPFWEALNVPRSLQDSGVGSIVVEEVFRDLNRAKTTTNAVILARVVELLPKVSLTDTSRLLNAIPSFFEKCPYLLSADGTSIYLLPGAVTITGFDSSGNPAYSPNPQLLTPVTSLINAFVKNEATLSTSGGTPTSVVADFQTRKKNLLVAIKQAFGLTGENDGFLLKVLSKPEFQQIKNGCFEDLYKLYVLRSVIAASMDSQIQQLQVLHALKFLAFDEYLEFSRLTTPTWGAGYPKYYVGQDELSSQLEHFLTEISDDANPIVKDLFIENLGDLIALHDASPSIQPILVRKAYYVKPFNGLQPVGIGDLKVVKQWLVGYRPGEISHIHNVLKGEINKKILKNIEKTEDTFTYSSEQDSSNQTENSTTDKFEVKREAEATIKNDLNITAGASFTYNSGPITANLTGNLASNNSQQQVQKTASNFARDVMSKAVSNVENKSTQQRTSSKQIETDEIYEHTFENNKTGATHISGIYRWVDKKYKAQLYNYGKRMMFEFIIPEPAAFFAVSKLKSYEANLKYPMKPADPTNPASDPHYAIAKNPLTDPTEVNKAKFETLRNTYDLSDLGEFPDDGRNFTFVDEATGKGSFTGTGDSAKWSINVFHCKAPDVGYRITHISYNGSVHFRDKNKTDTDLQSILALYLNGAQFEYHHDQTADDQVFLGIEKDVMLDISSGDFEFSINCQDVDNFQMNLTAWIERTPTYVAQWQRKVYDKIKAIEEGLVSKSNDELTVKYNADLADYNNAIANLTTQTANDILQGKSEAFNKEVVLTELKKHCLTLLTREFDSDSSDDILSGVDAVPSKNNFTADVERFVFTGGVGSFTTAPSLSVPYYPAIHLGNAAFKGNYIQFLEQAFEWNQLAYVFYPYFWAAERKWIDLMNRLDYTDPSMSEFLQAGSAKVLLAISPSYESAVMHYLATGEPWKGGRAPAINDPLYVPIYEEIRKAQDDLDNATPEGEPWDFTVPTSLIYLHGSVDQIPDDFGSTPS